VATMMTILIIEIYQFKYLPRKQERGKKIKKNSRLKNKSKVNWLIKTFIAINNSVD
jgi:hypothetical protein